MSDWIVALLMLVGASFTLIASIGLIRFPDLFTRMQAATKSSTLGVGCTVLAVAVYFGDLAVTTRAGLIIVFLFLTAPVAAHVIARAAYFGGVPLWEKSATDELRGRYDAQTHTLDSRAANHQQAPSPSGPDRISKRARR